MVMLKKMNGQIAGKGKKINKTQQDKENIKKKRRRTRFVSNL